jgi:hypothetical protein
LRLAFGLLRHASGTDRVRLSEVVMNWRIKKRTTIILLVAGLVVLALVGAGSIFWARTFGHYSPREVFKDVRAGLAAKNVPQPKERVETFLTVRYGPLTEPANRQRAFLDLFNVEHTKALDFISGRTPASQKEADTQAMADWVARYRKTMSKEERAALRACINSAAGKNMLQRSSAHYMAQEESIRKAQKPVMTELTTTLTSLWMP